MSIVPLIKRTNLSSIINNEKSIKDGLQKRSNKDITQSILNETIGDVSFKDYVHTLVDDLKTINSKFKTYEKLLGEYRQYVGILAYEKSRLKEQKQQLNIYVEEQKKNIDLDAVEDATSFQLTISKNKNLTKEEKIKKTQKKALKIRQDASDKSKKLIEIWKPAQKEINETQLKLQQQQELLKEYLVDISILKNSIIEDITTHMQKFYETWTSEKSNRFFNQHHKKYRKINTVLDELIIIENKIVNFIENITAEKAANALIKEEDAEAAAAAAQKKKKKRKKKKKKKKKNENNSKDKPPARAKVAAPQAPVMVEVKQDQPPEPVAVGESKQDPFRVRIEDIGSYLTKNEIPLKRKEDKSFIEQEENILQFIHSLNRKLAGKPYKLVITGGYAINMYGGKNKTGDVDMVLCHNNDVKIARGYITTLIFEVMEEKKMDMGKNNVQQLAPGTDSNNPTNPVKIRINNVQAIDITFKGNTNNFCKEVEVKGGFFVLKADFMKENLMEITDNFELKLADGVISHNGKLVSWLHQMTSLNKLLTGRSRTPSPHPVGGRKTRRKKRKTKRRKRRKSRKKKK